MQLVGSVRRACAACSYSLDMREEFAYRKFILFRISTCEPRLEFIRHRLRLHLRGSRFAMIKINCSTYSLTHVCASALGRVYSAHTISREPEQRTLCLMWHRCRVLVRCKSKHWIEEFSDVNARKRKTIRRYFVSFVSKRIPCDFVVFFTSAMRPRKNRTRQIDARAGSIFLELGERALNFRDNLQNNLPEL